MMLITISNSINVKPFGCLEPGCLEPFESWRRVLFNKVFMVIQSLRGKAESGWQVHNLHE